MIGTGADKQRLPSAEQALPGRATPLPLFDRHHVHGRRLREVPAGCAVAVFGMGCFWGAERLFWSLPGVVSTAVGYAGGHTPHPTYREVCSGLTGHAEVVRLVFDPVALPYTALLQRFWENHDPTQGMRQGNDAGTQYRSLILCSDSAQRDLAQASLAAYQLDLREAGFGGITTDIVHPAPPFYFAEDEHQQYLSKHPDGYCGLRGTGVACALP
jgi:peptide-methionine (S)-S-oxide reductase